MTTSQVINRFAGWANAELSFQVATNTLTEDPKTGNLVPDYVTLTYIAALNIEVPRYEASEGVDRSTFQCKGKLLEPVQLDSRLFNGSIGVARINRMYGKFELIIDPSLDPDFYQDLRQTISGTFKVDGGPNG